MPGGHEPRRLNFSLLSNLRKSREDKVVAVTSLKSREDKVVTVTSSSAPPPSVSFCVKLASLRKHSPKGICLTQHHKSDKEDVLHFNVLNLF